MDTANETAAVAAEIDATHGAIEAEALESRVEAADLVKEAMKETAQGVATQEVVVLKAESVVPVPAKEAKAAPVVAAPEVKAEKSSKQEESKKQEAKTPSEGTPEPKAQAKEQSTTTQETTDGEQKHTLTTSAFKALKAKAEEKGKKAAMEDISKALSEAGFTSFGDMLAAVKKAGTASPIALTNPQYVAPVAPQQQAQQAPPPAPHEPKPQSNGFAEAELRRATRERDRLSQELAAQKASADNANKRQKQMAKKIEAMEVDQELRESAISTGIKDVDYAMTLLQRDLAGKEDAELASFDEKQYFSDLRGTHGYLFGEKTELANTGTSAGTEPAAAPSARQAQSQIANQARPQDASKAPVNAVHDRIRALGLSLPTS